MYRIELSRQAEKDLGRIFRSDRRLYRCFLNAFEDIAQDPGVGKPLHGELRGLRSHRLGSYRILYELHHGKLLIVVVDLGHRREIYRHQ